MPSSKVKFIVSEIFLIWFLSQLAIATPIHEHCLTKKYEEKAKIEINLNETPIMTSPNTFGISFGIDNIPLDPNPRPEEPSGLCSYEISDIQQIDLTLTFNATEQLDVVGIGVTAGTNSEIVQGATIDDLPLKISNEVQKSFRFAPHQDPVNLEILEFNFGDDVKDSIFQLEVGLSGDVNFEVTKALVGYSGKHYFRTVPEPSTYALVGLGLCSTVWLKRKQNMIVRKEQERADTPFL